jgi:hypothetical protein
MFHRKWRQVMARWNGMRQPNDVSGLRGFEQLDDRRMLSVNPVPCDACAAVDAICESPTEQPVIDASLEEAPMLVTCVFETTTSDWETGEEIDWPESEYEEDPDAELPDAEFCHTGFPDAENPTEDFPDVDLRDLSYEELMVTSWVHDELESQTIATGDELLLWSTLGTSVETGGAALPDTTNPQPLPSLDDLTGTSHDGAPRFMSVTEDESVADNSAGDTSPANGSGEEDGTGADALDSPYGTLDAWWSFQPWDGNA